MFLKPIYKSRVVHRDADVQIKILDTKYIPENVLYLTRNMMY